MKIVKKILISVSFVLVFAQFFGPKKNDGDMATVDAFLTETKPPEEVKKILETTCFDCHSAKTTYPWYNAITPVNYYLQEHIKDGQKHLNFSEWNAYSLKKKAHKMDELYEEVEEGEMPLNSYTWLHADANLTTKQIAAVVTWGKKVQADYKQQLNTK
jgi:hypothetical protein